jgi:hypothetical protein
MDECKPLALGTTEERERLREEAGYLLGRAVQVDPIKPKLKAPGTGRLKLKNDKVLSNFAFKFNMRRYTSRCCSAGGNPPTSTRSNSRRRTALSFPWCSERLARCSLRRRVRVLARPEGAGETGIRRSLQAAAAGVVCWQGLALVHFSAQPEPFLTQNTRQRPLKTL